MGLFQRKGKGKNKNAEQKALTEEDEPPLPEIDADLTQRAQEVMKDHLSIMREVVMKIRHEDGYAKAMYANCPRLQYLLDRNPDLRPVFEDPRLVRINFETVYKEAGGILPEDEEAERLKREKPSLLMRIANHPIFKVLKVLLFVKKIIGCIAGGGIALVTGLWACMTDCCTDCCCEDALEEIGEVDEDEENEFGLDQDGPIDPNQQALNTAADYMEDPDVQEQMQRLLEDPENLEDAIENDAELRALRDSNPLCAELMQDPETMRILVDPDNLRALGEAPALIEMDFGNPDGFTPEADFVDVELGPMDGMDNVMESEFNASGEIDGLSMEGLELYDADVETNDVMFDMEDGAYGDEGGYDEDFMGDDTGIMAEEGFADEPGLEGEEPIGETPMEEPPVEETQAAATEANWEDDVELEQQDMNNNAASKGNRNAKQKKAQNSDAAKKGGLSGIVASFGVAATDVIASQIVGEVFGSSLIPGDFLGGATDIDLGGIETAADQADALVNDDVADLAEDTVDDVQDEKKDGEKEQNQDRKRGERNEARRASKELIDSSGRKVSGTGFMRDIAIAAGAGTGVGVMYTMKESDEDDLSDGLGSAHSDADESFDDEEGNASKDSLKKKKKKPSSTRKMGKKLFGGLKNLASATKTAAKETIVGALLGDDLAEYLVEKQEEGGSSSDEEEKSKKFKQEDSRELKKRRHAKEVSMRKQRDEEILEIEGELEESYEGEDDEVFDLRDEELRDDNENDGEKRASREQFLLQQSFAVDDDFDLMGDDDDETELGGTTLHTSNDDSSTSDGSLEPNSFHR